MNTINIAKLIPSYLVDICKYLKSDKQGLWKRFVAAAARGKYMDAAGLSLLQFGRDVDPEKHVELYDSVQRVAAAFGVNSAKFRLYLTHNSRLINAPPVCIAGEIHLALNQEILKKNKLRETDAIFGYKLFHYLLYNIESQCYFITERILNALACAAADSSYYQSARLFALYTEIFCDRGAYLAVRDISIVNNAFYKLSPGQTHGAGKRPCFEKAPAKRSIAAATEFSSDAETESESESDMEDDKQSEYFLRSQALSGWVDKQNEQAIISLTRAAVTIENLDLLEKKTITKQTRRLIQTILTYPGMRNAIALAYACQFFNNGNLSNLEQLDQRDIIGIRSSANTVKEYFSYILLDFCVLKRESVETSLIAGVALSSRIGIYQHFSELAKQELNLSRKIIDQLRVAAAFLDKSNSIGNNNDKY